jgi:dolichol-phosphate mannosyltransferase
VKVTVVIPTYNEIENLPVLTEALFALPLINLHILVVDDNSPDGTGKLAEELSIIHSGRFSAIHREKKLGLGTAYIMGFNKALRDGADALVQMDADFSHPPDLIPKLINALSSFDIAMGSRYVYDGGVDKNWPLWRKWLSGFGNIYARSILRLPVKDATGGYRAWRKETLQRMPLELIRSNGYAFQVEMAYVACRLGFSFYEVPFYFADRKWGTSKMSFQIQREAAIRVWQMLFEYRDIKPAHT